LENRRVRMKIKKIAICLIILVLLMSFVPLSGTIRADEIYGLVVTENGEMYRDLQGNLFPVIIVNGEKLVKLNEYELAPLEALLKRDEKESKGESALPEEILKKYHTSTYTYVTLSSIVSYNQRYWRWGSETLGFGPDTIAESGCFLTSCAMMLATYNLTINGSTVTPLNLNTWLKDFQHSPGYGWPHYPYESGGFDYDLLKFGAIANFPGISNIGYFDSFNDAAIAIYYNIVPILYMTPSHFSPLVKTNGERNRDTNWIMNTYWRDHYSYDYNTNLGRVYSPYTDVPYYQTVTQSGYNFASSSVFRTAFPQ